MSNRAFGICSALPYVQQSVHDSSPPIQILRQTIPAHDVVTYVINIHFNTRHKYTARLSVLWSPYAYRVRAVLIPATTVYHKRNVRLYKCAQGRLFNRDEEKVAACF